MQCSAQEAVYWYNPTSRDDVTTLIMLANRMYWYEQQIKEIDLVPDSPQSMEEVYKIDDLVWVKPAN